MKFIWFCTHLHENAKKNEDAKKMQTKKNKDAYCKNEDAKKKNEGHKFLENDVNLAVASTVFQRE